MILKFHKETERATDDTYKEYRALHELRKVLTELWVEFEMTRLKTIDDLKSLQYLNALASQDQSEKLVEVDMSTVPTYKSPGKSGGHSGAEIQAADNQEQRHLAVGYEPIDRYGDRPRATGCPEGTPSQ